MNLKSCSPLRRRLIIATALMALVVTGLVLAANQICNLKSWSLRADLPEGFARAWCAVDLYVLHRSPKFRGPKEPIMISEAAIAS